MSQNLDISESDRHVDAGFARLLACIDDGDRPIGWKIGVNSPPVQRRLSLAGPVLGVPTAAALARAGRLAVPGPGMPLIEAELALRLDAAGRVTAIAPAFELLCIDGALNRRRSTRRWWSVRRRRSWISRAVSSPTAAKP